MPVVWPQNITVFSVLYTMKREVSSAWHNLRFLYRLCPHISYHISGLRQFIQCSRIHLFVSRREDFLSYFTQLMKIYFHGGLSQILSDTMNALGKEMNSLTGVYGVKFISGFWPFTSSSYEAVKSIFPGSLQQHWRKKWKIRDFNRDSNIHGLLVYMYTLDSRSRRPASLAPAPQEYPIPPSTQECKWTPYRELLQ